MEVLGISKHIKGGQKWLTSYLALAEDISADDVESSLQVEPDRDRPRGSWSAVIVVSSREIPLSSILITGNLIALSGNLGRRRRRVAFALLLCAMGTIGSAKAALSWSLSSDSLPLTEDQLLAYPVQGLLRMRRIHFISSLSQVYIIFTLYWRIDADKVTSCRERHLETIHAKVWPDLKREKRADRFPRCPPPPSSSLIWKVTYRTKTI